jgi:hypothetical protein
MSNVPPIIPGIGDSRGLSRAAENFAELEVALVALRELQGFKFKLYYLKLADGTSY